MGVANIIIDIAVRAGNSAGEIDRTASRMDQFKQGMGALAGPAAVAAGAIGGVALAATKFASEAQQATGGVNAVFGQNAAAVNEWAKSSADSLGLAGAEYKTTMAGIGGALTGMGVATADAAQQSADLVARGADLASVFGGTTLDATNAMTSAFRGEYDSLQRLIPGISDAAVKQEMATQASQGMTFASEEAAKANAIYTTIMNKSTDAAGNFAKEADTAAGAQARAEAKFKDTAAALGEQLLPAVTQVMTWLTKVGDWVSNNIPLVTTLGAIIGGLALAVLAVNGAMAVYAAAQTAASVAGALWTAVSGAGAAATTAFGIAMAILTSPITIIIAAIAAVIAIVVLLVKNWDTVSEAAAKCWEVISDAVGTAVDWIKGAVGTVIDWLKSGWQNFADFVSGIWDEIKGAAAIAWEVIKSIVLGPIYIIIKNFDTLKAAALVVWEAIKTAGTAIWSAIKSAAESALAAIMWPINKVKAAIDAVINAIKSAISFATSLLSKIPFIGGLFGSSASSATQASAPQRFMVTASTPSLARSGVMTRGQLRGVRMNTGPQITINGALDPVQTARQIQRLLQDQARRVGAVAI